MKNIPVTIPLMLLILGGGCGTPNRLGDDTPDRRPTWYYFEWLARAPYAPTFQVLDTESSLGPYAAATKTITLKDLVKWHGHACDGLVTAACALSLGLRELYPDGVVDRTDTAGISNNSPCYGDVIAYLTGGRIRFGTQKIAGTLGHEFILYRMSTRQAVRVFLKPGRFPEELADLERRIRTGSFQPRDIRECQQRQWAFARELVSHPLEESFGVERLEHFVWEPDPYPHRGLRGDVLLKDYGTAAEPESLRRTR